MSDFSLKFGLPLLCISHLFPLLNFIRMKSQVDKCAASVDLVMTSVINGVMAEKTEVSGND